VRWSRYTKVIGEFDESDTVSVDEILEELG